MIVWLLEQFMAFLWAILWIAFTIYFKSPYQSWTSAVVVHALTSCFVVAVINYPVAWFAENCRYLPDIIVLGLLGCAFMGKGGSSDENESTEASESPEE